ncbi:MAG: hypothetical protein HQM06_07740 [Magnetococcales bacterium]|nr:hypothetical protein [Magnetococcales bacterium]
MLKFLHQTSAIVAFLCVSLFWLSTLIAELFLTNAAVAQIKQWILSGLFLLIPSLAMAAFTGMRMERGGYLPRLESKKKRMPFLAGNGLLILLPCAFFLASKAGRNEFDINFYMVQTIELLSGLVQWLLLRKNMIDGRNIRH